MSICPRDGRCWPTPRQELLLKATLLQGEVCLAAWREWRAEGLDDVDWGSFRLLPLLYRNLQAQAVNDPLMPTLRGIYRRFWYENQVRFRDAQPLLRLFQDAGIDTMLLKGAALTLLHYRDSGTRPMQDIDILVPEDRLQQVVDLLRHQHWASQVWIPDTITESYLCFRHAALFVDHSDRKLDIHWHVLYLACAPRADQVFWRDSVPLAFHGIPTRALNATDQLLHACLHGAAAAEQNGAPRWIADAVTVIRSSPPLDWDRVLHLARELSLAFPLRDSLRYLKTEFDAPVPAELLESLDRQPISEGERLFFERIQMEEELQRPFDTLRALMHQHSRSFPGRSLPVRLATFPYFLQYYWGLPGPWHAVPQTARWFLHRLRLRRNRKLLA